MQMHAVFFVNKSAKKPHLNLYISDTCFHLYPMIQNTLTSIKMSHSDKELFGVMHANYLWPFALTLCRTLDSSKNYNMKCGRHNDGILWEPFPSTLDTLALAAKRSSVSFHQNLVHGFIPTTCIRHIGPVLYYLKSHESLTSVNPKRVELRCNHFSNVIMARRHLKSPASRLFTQPFIETQIKENIKAPRHWPLWGEFTDDHWIPRIKGQ